MGPQSLVVKLLQDGAKRGIFELATEVQEPEVARAGVSVSEMAIARGDAG